MSDECHVCDELDAELMETKKALLYAKELLRSAPIGGADADVIRFVDARRAFLNQTEGEPK